MNERIVETVYSTELPLQILPVITREGTFALKGGTAINLFELGYDDILKRYEVLRLSH